MQRPLLLSFLFSALAGALSVAAACDPDLSVKPAGDAVPEGGAPTPTPPRADAGGSVVDAHGGSDDGASDSAADSAAPHAHAIDGANDFLPGEKLATTSSATGYSGYVSWDDERVYFGMSGADVGSNSPTKWVLIYVDGNPGNAGTTQGVAYNGTEQRPSLPFNAGFHIQWKTDNTYTHLVKWNAATTTWDDAGPLASVAKGGTFMELAVLRAALGSPTTLKVHLNMLIEGGGLDFTYAGVPATSFSDAKNPHFTKYYEFNLADHTTAPNTYPIK
jgi:hypothetical protein